MHKVFGRVQRSPDVEAWPDHTDSNIDECRRGKPILEHRVRILDERPELPGAENIPHPDETEMLIAIASSLRDVI